MRILDKDDKKERAQSKSRIGKIFGNIGKKIEDYANKSTNTDIAATQYFKKAALRQLCRNS